MRVIKVAAALCFVSLLAWAGWYTVPREDWHLFGRFWGGLLGLLLAYVALQFSALALHEGAHAATAWATGHDLYSICIGFRPPFRFRKVLGIWLIFGHPLRGGGFCLPLLRRLPPRQALLHVVAGPLASLLAALALALLAARFPYDTWSFRLLAAAALLNAGYGLLSLIPHRLPPTSPFPRTDGGILLDALRSSPDETFRKLLRDYAGSLQLRGRTVEAIQALRDGVARFPEDAELRTNLLAALARELPSSPSAGDLEREILAAEGESDPRARALCAMALSTRGGSEDLRRADALSLEAYTKLPVDALCRIVRFHVLEATGRPDDALPLLALAHRDCLLPPHRGDLAAELGLRLARRGNVPRARRLLKEAEGLGASGESLRLLRSAARNA